MRHRASCQSVQLPRYQLCGAPFALTGPGSGRVQVARRNWAKGAVKTAATSLGSSRGMSLASGSVAAVSSWELVVTSSVEEAEEEDGEEEVEEDWDDGHNTATQGRTPSSVFARFSGSSHRCSTRNPAGSWASVVGSPISS